MKECQYEVLRIIFNPVGLVLPTTRLERVSVGFLIYFRQSFGRFRPTKGFYVLLALPTAFPSRFSGVVFQPCCHYTTPALSPPDC